MGKHPLRKTAVARPGRNFNFSPCHRAGCRRRRFVLETQEIAPVEYRVRNYDGGAHRAGIWLRYRSVTSVGGSEVGDDAPYEGEIESKRARGNARGRDAWVGSNYLNIRRRGRASSGNISQLAPYYASNLRPAVRARCFRKAGTANERVRAEPSDGAVAAGLGRLRRASRFRGGG